MALTFITGNTFANGDSATSTKLNNIVNAATYAGQLEVAAGGTGLSTFGGANTLLYTSAANTLGSLTTANNGVLITSGAGVPSISSTIPAATQANITQTGTITSGTWNGTTLAVANGGTGLTTFGGANTLLYTSSANTLGSLITANNGVLITSGTGVPSISSTIPAATQLNITQLGTITAGTWNGTTLAVANGGTGLTTFGGSNTLLYTTSANNLSLISAANNSVLISTGIGVPAWSVILPSAVQVNITQTGTITSGIWNGTTLAIANGGTGSTTASTAFNALSPMTTLGDVIYGGTAGAGTRLAGNITGTRNFLRQTGTGAVSAAPAWDTVTKTDVGLANVENTALSTWAGSTNITTLGTITTGTWNGTTLAVANGGTGLTTFGGANTLLYTSAANTLGSLTTANNGVLITSGAGVPSISSTIPAATQANITQTGTITSGTWNGTTIAVANGGTGGTTAATARSGISVFGSNLQSTGTVTQAGTLGNPVVYNVGGPSVSLTAGTWLLWGSAAMRTNDTGNAIFWLGFNNATDGIDFGQGATAQNNTDLSVLYHVSCFGFLTVASGTKTIYLKGFINGSHTPEIGAVNGIGGAIRAILLYI